MTFLPSMSWRTPAPQRRSPGYIEPCIPTRSSKPPVGPQWFHEIKHDGYRLIVRKQDGRVRLSTRRGCDWTDRYPVIRDAAARLRARSVTIDGEAVYCDGTGLAIFEKLHSRVYDDRVFLYAFDLLELDGVDYRSQELWRARSGLKGSWPKSAAGLRSMSISPAMARPFSSMPASWASRVSSQSIGNGPTDRVGPKVGSR
jgi:ATP-dependent DNA ligase